MISIRRAGDRGHFDHGWLDTFHSFSFAEYRDPRYAGFRSLRVINEDRVAPGKGFGTHGHRDMEILSFVLAGAMEHRDSLGTGSVIRPGEVQRMTAGTGVRHSEFNASESDMLHFLQVWIFPESDGLPPGYEQRAFPEPERSDRLCLVASREGRDGSLTIHQDVDVMVATLRAGASVEHALRPGRAAWVQVASGELGLNGDPMQAGDGAAVTDEESIAMTASRDAAILVFDLA
jgi:redox-sensitive bicupin YhaK (pirin superfamily)